MIVVLSHKRVQPATYKNTQIIRLFAAGTNNYFLRVICRNYSVSRLTCGDWVLSKTQILQVVLMKLQKMWSLKTLHIVVGYFLVWQVIKTLPPPPTTF